MKKNLIRVATAFAATAILAFTGCTTTYDTTANASGWSNYAEITVKDFTAVGIVSVESTETTKVSPFKVTTNINGKRVIYADLMEEAKKLGADDIINVRVDQRSHGVTRGAIMSFLTGSTTTVDYYGTAVAIKYTNVAPNQVQERSPSRSTSSLKEAAAAPATNTGFFGSLVAKVKGIFSFGN